MDSAERPDREPATWEVLHSVVSDTSRRSAWRYWTDVTNWRRHEGDAVESITLHGPFRAGTQGTTKLPGESPQTWTLVEVQTPERAIIEMKLDGAVLRFTWTFEELGATRTRLTQRITLGGPSAGRYSAEVEAVFAPNIRPGMEKLARDMSQTGGSL